MDKSWGTIKRARSTQELTHECTDEPPHEKVTVCVCPLSRVYRVAVVEVVGLVEAHEEI